MKNYKPSQCPYCKNSYIVKNGKNNNKQRYLCKSCKKSFVYTTNTAVYYTKKSKKLWQKYIDYLYNQLSLRSIAYKLNISVTTAFYWRHKLLDCLRNQNSNDVLSNIIHCKEMIMNQSYKGNFSNSSFSIPRDSYNSNTCSAYLIKRKKISVLVACDNNDELIFAPTPKDNTSETSLIAALSNNIAPNSTLITYNIPNLSLYKSLYKYNIDNLSTIYSYKTLCTYFSLNKFIVADCDSYLQDSSLYKRSNLSGNSCDKTYLYMTYINNTNNNLHVTNKNTENINLDTNKINSNTDKNNLHVTNKNTENINLGTKNINSNTQNIKSNNKIFKSKNQCSDTSYGSKINFSKLDSIIINYSFFIYPYKGISSRYLLNYLALFKSICTNKSNSIHLLSFVGLKPFYPWNYYNKTA